MKWPNSKFQSEAATNVARESLREFCVRPLAKGLASYVRAAAEGSADYFLNSTATAS
ncbi:hypothetical protein DES53_102157 [Roseimicrobium gellanilyticum]|uniref:Uncharacterized protein n=1 Tax=Roseimicrobium gellanilyticum TaxID=748857 RepID=A0A366HQ28_9BACT|nr:hypothetical protein DES53_102157 [Roseimicrobium gellanilyticum]